MYISRITESLISEESRHYPVILVTGPRQSGKTTLIKHLFPQKKYTNLEDSNDYEFASSDPIGFLAQSADGLIIDEVQRIPSLLSQIQVMVDNQLQTGRFILSGSQNLLLGALISQSLAGRVSIITLLPLSLEERFRTIEEPLPSLENLLYTGSYPRVISQAMNPTRYYQNYIQTYLERDVRQLKNIQDLSIFQRFIRFCANRIGQILNVSNLADDTGISHRTAESWLSVLEASYIITLLQPYYSNFNKRLIKAPKLFFNDVGLLCSLLGIESEEMLSFHPLKGLIFENFVALELIKYQLQLGKKANLFFWRDKHGTEIDIIYEKGPLLHLIEVKAGQTLSSDYFKALTKVGKEIGDKLLAKTLLYCGSDTQNRTDSNVRRWQELVNPKQILG